MFKSILEKSKTSFPQFEQYANAHRKPRWLPVAKSKIYRIPKRPVIPIEEKKELTRLFNNYHTQMRALRRYYHEEMLKEKLSTADLTSEESIKKEALDFERCLKINEEWNADRAKERDIRLASERDERDRIILETIQRKQTQKEQEIIKANKLIQFEKEASKTFITREGLEQAIEEALANPIDYNFAIDLDGKKYNGRDTNLLSEKKNETESVN